MLGLSALSIASTVSLSNVLLVNAHNSLILLILQLWKIRPREGGCLGKVV